MPVRSLALTPVVLLTLACSPPRSPAAAPAQGASTDARCAVWNRELSFAKSVAEHDAVAFGEHVLEGAVFVGDTTLRGRAAVVKGWATLLQGEKLRLAWRPAEVVVTSDPHVAMSRGPVWIEIDKPGAPPKRLLGSYQSTWVLDRDGVWRVAVDGGKDPKEVTEDELQKSKNSSPATCPP
jgi:ketosteroid isomerase-like protein